MIVPYNLPPSLCMRKEFTMLTLLIPGKKKGPGHDIDIYLQPLIEELNELWSTGTITYDSYNKSRFTMKASLLWAIHDFPPYGHLSGCRIAGKLGCPVCGEGTNSLWLNHGKKCAYMEHRRFLPNLRHPFRSQKSQSNGNEENKRHPRRLSGSEVLNKMETIQTNFGKSKKRKRSTEECDSTAWSKRSIFFDLPFWKVFGRDGKGRVLCLGMGVSKTAIQHSAPYKRALEEEHEANTHLQTQVKRLKEEIDGIKQVLSLGGMQHSSTCHESSSQAHDGSPHEEVRMGTNQNSTSHTREGSCRLLSSLRKEITVAVGHVMGLSIDKGATIGLL